MTIRSNAIFITEHNNGPNFISTLSRMRGHHPRGRELYEQSLIELSSTNKEKIELYYRGACDERKDPIKDEAKKVIAKLKEGREVYLDGNRLKELVEYLETNRSDIEAKEGANIFDKLSVIIEPPSPVPMLTKDLYYAKTIAGMWIANKELEHRKVS